MKAFITTSILIVTVAVCPVFSQFTKGTWMAGGSASAAYSSSKTAYTNSSYTTSEKSFSTTFMPTAGYFVADNIAVGVGISETASFYHDPGQLNQHSTDVNYSVFGRYYYKNFFGMASVNIGRGSVTESADPNEIYSTKTYGFNLGVGYAWLLTKSLAVEPMIGYKHETYTETDDDRKFLYPNLYLQIGFQVYLNRH